VCTRDGRVDKQTHALRSDAGIGKGLGAGHRSRIGKRDVLGPPAALDDAREALEQAGTHIESRIGVCQGNVDFR
jgi:hypothetical protein